jgi:hypothetical protein
MSLVEQRGVPTVSIVSGGFEEAWRRSAAAYGLATLPMVVIPRVITNQPAADIDAMVDASMEELISSLAEPVEAGPVIEELVPQAETIDIQGDDLLDAFHRMNGLFLEYEWSDGLPLVPPAPELVERMLKATGRDPQEVVAVLEPTFGLATVEKIAINAAMAGCKPEHLPVLIAAVQAIASPPFMMRDAAVSTGSRSPLLVVNGPIAKRLGLNSGACALPRRSFLREHGHRKGPAPHLHEHRGGLRGRDRSQYHRSPHQVQPVCGGERGRQPLGPVPRGDGV